VWAVVIPAKDEAGRIGVLLQQLLRLPVGLVIPVINGCTDMTEAVVSRQTDARIRPLSFAPPLGYDVPRIAGAEVAHRAGASVVIFVDADLTGQLDQTVVRLAQAVVEEGVDLALTDCYAQTRIPFRESAARQVYQRRLQLNEELGRPDLGVAIPSHGPVAVSRRLLTRMPGELLGVPPLMQAHAVRDGLRVAVAASLPHRLLGSAPRPADHRLRIAETIIGDCLAGRNWARGEGPDREGHLGYHPYRRFDLLGLVSPDGPGALPNSPDGGVSDGEP
jgi:hypothetical protein